MLIEANHKQFENDILIDGMTVVLAYTTMCGTCESAKRMLDIVSEAVREIDYLKINVNLNKGIIEKFDITSIPCFLVFKKGILVEQFYAFHSVTYLFDKISKIK